jgi:hypothetical protein
MFQSSGKTFNCHSFMLKMEAAGMQAYTKLHGVISPKTSIFAVTTTRTSDLINEIPVP